MSGSMQWALFALNIGLTTTLPAILDTNLPLDPEEDDKSLSLDLYNSLLNKSTYANAIFLKGTIINSFACVAMNVV